MPSPWVSSFSSVALNNICKRMRLRLTTLDITLPCNSTCLSPVVSLWNFELKSSKCTCAHTYTPQMVLGPPTLNIHQEDVRQTHPWVDLMEAVPHLRFHYRACLGLCQVDKNLTSNWYCHLSKGHSNCPVIPTVSWPYSSLSTSRSDPVPVIPFFLTQAAGCHNFQLIYRQSNLMPCLTENMEWLPLFL